MDSNDPRRRQAHPNPIRAQEWYEWEKARDEARRKARIEAGCVFLILMGLIALSVIGIFAIANFAADMWGW